MGGIIHEWSAESPADLVSLLAWTCEKFQLAEIGILIPGELVAAWEIGELERVKLRREDWPVSLCKAIGSGTNVDGSPLAKLFVWGLDAI